MVRNFTLTWNYKIRCTSFTNLTNVTYMQVKFVVSFMQIVVVLWKLVIVS